MFDGSINHIKCITEHEDYVALSNRTVLLQVAPLLKPEMVANIKSIVGDQKMTKYNSKRVGYTASEKCYVCTLCTKGHKLKCSFVTLSLYFLDLSEQLHIDG